eukprot:Unigene13771_Nuclearia_a/m.41629 Unigene13771_Nuclearia_a/g.41629  ORF Unigene13771_Nuclearia_a/g.41629 Unigene13771_Nuclearia_a/m.41629 type:complete len:603 (+) Unigene13771_Nuclearia_a:3124-4932(+)
MCASPGPCVLAAGAPISGAEAICPTVSAFVSREKSLPRRKTQLFSRLSLRGSLSGSCGGPAVALGVLAVAVDTCGVLPPCAAGGVAERASASAAIRPATVTVGSGALPLPSGPCSGANSVEAAEVLRVMFPLLFTPAGAESVHMKHDMGLPSRAPLWMEPLLLSLCRGTSGARRRCALSGSVASTGLVGEGGTRASTSSYRSPAVEVTISPIGCVPARASRRSLRAISFSASGLTDACSPSGIGVTSYVWRMTFSSVGVVSASDESESTELCRGMSTDSNDGGSTASRAENGVSDTVADAGVGAADGRGETTLLCSSVLPLRTKRVGGCTRSCRAPDRRASSCERRRAALSGGMPRRNSLDEARCISPDMARAITRDVGACSSPDMDLWYSRMYEIAGESGRGAEATELTPDSHDVRLASLRELTELPRERATMVLDGLLSLSLSLSWSPLLSLTSRSGTTLSVLAALRLPAISARSMLVVFVSVALCVRAREALMLPGLGKDMTGEPATMIEFVLSPRTRVGGTRRTDVVGDPLAFSAVNDVLEALDCSCGSGALSSSGMDGSSTAEFVAEADAPLPSAFLTLRVLRAGAFDLSLVGAPSA